MNFFKRLPAAMVPVLLLMWAGSILAQTSDLFFSEYLEGSSNNKALEIYNGTGNAVDLADYTVELYSNGSITPGNTLTLSDAAATLANGDVLVIANSSASQDILNAADITSNVTFFNGDDALALLRNGVIIDVIGVIGSDPGSQWGSGDASTGENTIRRLNTVCAGDPNGFGNPADITDQWEGFPQNTSDGLGIHIADCGGSVNLPVSINCGSALETTEGVAASTSVSASDPDGTIASITITGVSPAPASGSISAGALSGGAVTVTVSGDVPAGSYSVTLSAANDDATPQTDSCTLTVNVALGFTGWVINEIHADPASDITGDANGDGVRNSSADEFVEIVNTTGSAQDISGWIIQDGFGTRHVFPNGTVVDNDAAIVVFGGGTPTGTFGDALVQTASTGSVGLNNGGDTVTLLNGGLVMAEESYGSEGGSNQSLTRDPDITGGFVRHTTASTSGGTLYSPGTLADGTPFVVPGAEDLFFSEYIEGSSSNKALEIYNGTGAAADLSEYSVELYSNGSTSPGNTLNLSAAAASLANGDVLVIANSSATSAILDVADITSSVTFFNGDDAIVLKRNGEIIDIIGILGNDPGSEWGSGSASTRDNTIRRLSTVCAGDADGFDNSGDISDQWAGFPQNTFDGLGAHFADCGGGGEPPNEPVSVDCGDNNLLTIAGYGNSGTVTAADADGNVSSIAITGISPAPAAGSITIGSLVTGSEGSAVVTASSDVPAGSYEVTIEASNDDAQPQSETCVLTVEVLEPISIAAIQGSGASSPFENQNVATAGNIVTGYANNGFFMQTPDADVDADPNTSEGLFVFTGNDRPAEIGDEVAVVGGMVEYFGLTEFSGNVSVFVLSSGNAQPSAAVLDANTPSPNFNDMERFESQLVSVSNGFALSGTNRFGDTYMTAGSSRIFREPGIVAPGLPGLPVWDGNPEIFEINPDGAGLPNTNIIGGSSITAMGPVSYAFGDYQLFPLELTVTPPAVFPIPVRDRVDHVEFTVGTMNMLRLFVDQPSTSGYADRLSKFSLQIREVMGSPDIIAFQEVGGIAVLDDLSARLQADDSNLIYTSHLIPGNDIGGIDTGFLVRDTMQVNGLTQYRADSTFQLPDGRIIPLHDRPPLVLDAVYQGGDLPFDISVMVVHNRSLVGSNDPEDGDWIRAKRYGQALEIGQVVNDLQTADPDINLVVTGDFNAFEFTDGYVDSLGMITGSLDPLGALETPVDVVDPDLTNQTFLTPQSDRYSFIFSGSSQVLDHVLTSSALDEHVQGVQYGHNNTDAPNSDSSDPTTASRASDHDPAVLFVMSIRDTDGDGIPDDEDACPTSDTSATVAINGCDSGVTNHLLADGCTIIDRINQCIADGGNHGQIVSCVSHMLNDLKKDGIISGSDKGKITSCVAQSVKR